MSVVVYGSLRTLWRLVGAAVFDLQRWEVMDKAYELPASNPEHHVQYALYKSMHKPTKWDCLAWATERELRRELRKRRVRRQLRYITRRSCDTALAVIDKLAGK